MTSTDAINLISEAVNAALAPYMAENEELRESLADVQMMLSGEDHGWLKLLGPRNGDERGLSLDEVKTIAKKARTKVAAASFEKRASDLHGGYVFGNGLEIADTVRNPRQKGRPPASIGFFEDTINQESIFSDGAQKELQRERFVAGNVIVFCDSATKRVRRIPIEEIAAVMVHPDHDDEITAWLREYSHVNQKGETETRRVWAYTNRHEGPRQKSIKVGNEYVPVLPNVTAVDLRANRQVGWRFGVPDATAGMMWAEAYGIVLHYGQKVNEALSKIVYKVTNKSKAGAANVGVKMKSASSGGVAAIGEGQDIQLVNSSQRSFDFGAAQPLAAMAASAWNISVVDLLSSPAASGSSYGAANSLTAGVRNAMRGMQKDWTQFYQDIFVAVGLGRPVIHWPPMEAPDAYRLAQEITLYSPALSDEEYRGVVLDRLDLPGDPAQIPPSLKMRNEPKVQAASPDQGQSNGTGGASSTDKNDQRSDTISNEALAWEIASMKEMLAKVISGQ